ncbi:glycoside hydrolase family 92 protein [Gluconobacter cerevisiae]|uniref:Glycoside hydrolase family 92 protein n=1 Tax=Gluconobacter cerevisiae TaxID=1379734 RepID=A0ABR9Y9R2_9PROT|nr:GH92 family glycosyl hydrolase [Gluconobacter cerevisiae]MBF0875376.1 glycoside hydrolase family 92 protein [Gluconobacter cerevisiae]
MHNTIRRSCSRTAFLMAMIAMGVPRAFSAPFAPSGMAEASAPFALQSGSGPDWSLSDADGPTKNEVLTARAGSGLTGLRTLRLDTTATDLRTVIAKPNSAFRINRQSHLTYAIFPVADALSLTDDATDTSLDILFTDGTRASTLGARDLSGAALTAQGQGAGRALYPNQWTLVDVPLGNIAAGRTVAAVELASHAPNGTTRRVYLDAVSIADRPDQTGLTPADLVDTRRGTNANGHYSRGNNFPAVAVPHGFNFWTPVTRGNSNWLYQYQERNGPNNHPRLEALSLSHEPSPWMGDRNTFQIMPALGPDAPSADRTARVIGFTHDHETALPYRYAVTLDNGITADLSPTDHAAILRFRYPDGTTRGQVVFDNITNQGRLKIAPDGRSADGYTDVASDLSTGASRMYVHLEFDRPAVAQGRLTGQKRDDVQAWAAFDTTANPTVTLRIATSLISLDQARYNLALELPPGATLETAAQSAKAAWNSRLDRVQIPGAPLDEQRTLYGNLYRLYLYPNNAAENVGTIDAPHLQHASPFQPRKHLDSPTQTGVPVLDGPLYVNNGFWDTYRTAWPAYALLTPEEDGQLIDGFVQQYREGGWIARWSSPGYADLMTGTSADVAFADAYAKHVRNFNVAAFYRAGLKDATVMPDNPGVGRKGLNRSMFRGYTDTDTDEALSWSNAATLNDFALGEMAVSLSAAAPDATKADYAAESWYLHNRALNYVHLFDRDVGFFVGRRPDGQWRVPKEQFDPLAWGGDYTETNAWTMAFDPVQDGQGLASLYGGRDGLAHKLDAYFATPGVYHTGAYGGVIHEMREMHDIRMGQYSHSNQPAHHILYLYDTAGQPWKAQDKIRDVMNRLYRGTAIGQGYPGDEDNGEMSAWWVFSAAGFYPLRMGTPTYAIGAPRFETMRLTLGKGHILTVRAPGISDRNRFVQSVSLNGKPLTRWWLDHDDIADGGDLLFRMGPHPSHWGTAPEASLPSLTPAGHSPDPAIDLTDIAGATHTGSEALFDNDALTSASIGTTDVTVTLPAGASALAYTLTSTDMPGHAPSAWDVLASDDGKTWQKIDHRENETFPWKHQTRPFLLPDRSPHRLYRWHVLQPTSAEAGEFELLGHTQPSSP